LLQYGQRVWNITEGTDDERIEKTINQTESFFNSLGIKTKLSDYGVGVETIDKIVNRFEQRGWKAIGDRQLVTPVVIRAVLMHQLK
jgi:NADP-dependent alcohol dehydrogenase